MSLERKDFFDDAELLQVPIAAIQAVAEVESAGGGFLKNGKPKILFEGHKFWQQLIKVKINPKVLLQDNPAYADILHERWTKRYYNMNQYLRLNKAENIHVDAALKSASWGMFQIMGFNHKRAGFKTVADYVAEQYIDENAHLMCFTKFIKSDINLLRALQRQDWETFARLYNGSRYKKNKYDTKLATAFAKYSNR